VGTTRETVPGRQNMDENSEASGLGTPLISVTIPPHGRCYQLASRFGEQLARAHRSDASHSPHLTLQGIYDGADLAVVCSCVEKVAAATRPFAVRISGVGILSSPADPNLQFLHLNVEKSPSLLDLYTRLKQSLEALGLRTYPYSPEDWVPHLTLASGHWSQREMREMLGELDHEMPGCILPVAEADVNHRAAIGDWHLVKRCPFASAG
jgi:2'-5' RNA ligase